MDIDLSKINILNTGSYYLEVTIIDPDSTSAAD